MEPTCINKSHNRWPFIDLAVETVKKRKAKETKHQILQSGDRGMNIAQKSVDSEKERGFKHL